MPTFKMCAFASVSGSDLNEPQMKKNSNGVQMNSSKDI